MTRTIDIDQYEVEFEVLESYTNTHFGEEEHIAKGYEILSIKEDGVEIYDKIDKYTLNYIKLHIEKHL
jgi:hypothetical protein